MSFLYNLLNVLMKLR